MRSFGKRIAPVVERELDRASESLEPRDAFRHLERAHVLGQASTYQHVRVHLRMLVWGVAQRDIREVFGQALRIIGAATKTAFGMVPTGNTGGSNISPFKPLPEGGRFREQDVAEIAGLWDQDRKAGVKQFDLLMRFRRNADARRAVSDARDFLAMNDLYVAEPRSLLAAEVLHELHSAWVEADMEDQHGPSGEKSKFFQHRDAASSKLLRLRDEMRNDLVT